MDARARGLPPLRQRSLRRPAGEAMPPVAIVNYSAIDSGLGGPPYPVSVVGVDRESKLGRPRCRQPTRRSDCAWCAALIAAIDRAFPGFAAHVVASVFSTASTMSTYLNAPEARSMDLPRCHHAVLSGTAPSERQGPRFRGSTSPRPTLAAAATRAPCSRAGRRPAKFSPISEKYRGDVLIPRSSQGAAMDKIGPIPWMR